MTKLIWDQCQKPPSTLKQGSSELVTVTSYSCRRLKGQWGDFCPFGISQFCRRSVSCAPLSLLLSVFLLLFPLCISFFLACSSLFVILSQSPYFCFHCYLCHPVAPGFLLPRSISIFPHWSQFSSLPSARMLRGRAVRWNPDRLTSDPQREVGRIGL